MIATPMGGRRSQAVVITTRSTELGLLFAFSEACGLFRGNHPYSDGFFIFYMNKDDENKKS